MAQINEAERDGSGSGFSSEERSLKRFPKWASWFILLAALTLLWIGTLGTLLAYSLRAFFLR